jgi:hypothetical protein
MRSGLDHSTLNRIAQAWLQGGWALTEAGTWTTNPGPLVSQASDSFTPSIVTWLPGLGTNEEM